MNPDRRTSPFRFPLFLIVSLGVHAFFLSYLVYSYREDLAKLLLAAQSPKILVDLTDPQNDLFDPDKKVISRYNYAGKGKLVPKPGQHLTGKFNPATTPESTALQKPDSRSAQKDADKKKAQVEMIPDSDSGIAVAEKVGEKTSSPKDNVSTPTPQKQRGETEDKRSLAVDTEDSLENKFWFDESEYLQISVRSHPDAEFSLELANLLKERFSTYVMGGGALNFYHVKRDEATALATISSKGDIAFVKMIKSSDTQPYMNYLVNRVVDNPGIIKHLPEELRGKNSETLHFLFNIRFTGEPLRKWWMGFEFLPNNISSR